MEKGESEFVRIGCMVFEVELRGKYLNVVKIKGKFDGGDIETREEALLYAKRVRRLANSISDGAKKLPTRAMITEALERRRLEGKGDSRKKIVGEVSDSGTTLWPHRPGQVVFDDLEDL